MEKYSKGFSSIGLIVLIVLIAGAYYFSTIKTNTNTNQVNKNTITNTTVKNNPVVDSHTNVLPSKKSITVLSPNGGETIKIGQSYTIKWDTTGFSPSDNVAIFLEDDSIHCAPGIYGCWSSFGIGRDFVKNTGSYVWDTNQKMFGDAGPDSVQVIPGNNYKIYLRIDSKIDTKILSTSDESDNEFTIVK